MTPAIARAKNPTSKRRGTEPKVRKPRGFSIALASYTIRIRRKRETSQYETLGTFNGKDSFLAFVVAFANGLRTQHLQDELAMSLQRSRQVKSDERSVCGIVEAGDYGIVTQLVNVDTMVNSYTRGPSDAELYPFYFLLDAPAKANKAILVLQRFGTRGIFGEFIKALRDAFAAQFADYLLEVAWHVPGAVLEFLEKGDITKIQLRSYDQTTDVADRLHYKGNPETIGRVETTLYAKRGRSLEKGAWIKNILARKRDESQLHERIIESDDAHAPNTQAHETFRIGLRYNGKQKFVDLSSPEHVAPYIDVTSDVSIDGSGHPIFTSIDACARNLLADIDVEIGRDY